MELNPGTDKDKGQGRYIWLFYLMSLASGELVLQG